MALSDQDKTDIRFYLGYSFRGTDPNSSNGLHIHEINPYLEDRMLRLSSTEETRVRQMLDDLREMEEEINAAREALRIKEAGSFKRNPGEIRDRIQLYDRRRLQLARWLGATLRTEGSGGFIV